MDPTTFLSALLAIVVIDVVLAGDNAIVIALAARRLPPALQKRAIVWGAIGAIAVRSLMTVLVVWLLQIPGLLLAGGLLLVWIACKLLSPEGEADAHRKPAPATFWAAMRTIVVADAVMGLDNVLAVAGAAHGSYLLVVAGLVISVPIVVWGSTLVLKVVERHPGVVYVGAGVLVWTAVTMVLGEPLIAPWLAAMPVLGTLAYLAVPIVLGMAFWTSQRRRSARVRGRPAASTQKCEPVRDVLVPVDGSSHALDAVRRVVAAHRGTDGVRVHLLALQPRFSRHVARFVGRRDRDDWLRDRADAAIAAPVALLTDAGLAHEKHRASATRADEIGRMARELAVQRIVLGVAPAWSISGLLDDVVANRVIEAAAVPVEVVAGRAVSGWERWGWPACLLALGGIGGLLVLAAD